MKMTFSLLLFLIGSSAFGQSAKPDTIQHFNSFDGTRIAYQVKGSGAPVFLIHGFISNSDSWRRALLYKDLIAAGYQVILPDLRGNGRSDKPHTAEAYMNDAEAKDIIKLADILKLTSFDVVGYSRGAIITSRVLLLDERVRKSVLGGMGSDFTNPQWPRRIMFYEALSGKPVKELEAVILRIKNEGLDQQALAYMQNGQPCTSKEELGSIKKPVLVICGSEDEDNGSSKELASLIHGAKYIRVPGDHGGTSKSKEFSVAVLSFLKREE
jgi:pimeloyl-ACP methyl ester carboxylesterase